MIPSEMVVIEDRFQHSYLELEIFQKGGGLWAFQLFKLLEANGAHMKKSSCPSIGSGGQIGVSDTSSGSHADKTVNTGPKGIPKGIP